MDDYGSNEALLKQVASFTGGHYRPAPGDVFDAGGRSLAGSMRLWPFLIGLALALSLGELIERKWKTIALPGWLRGRS
jgi:hypothetical protein